MGESTNLSNAEKRQLLIEDQTRGIGGHVTICSIEPIRFKRILNHLRGFTEDYMDRNPGTNWMRRGRTEYAIEAADPVKKWSILRVWPAYEMAHNPDKGQNGDEDPDSLKETHWHAAAEIAAELCKQWGDVVIGQEGSRGLGIIGDDTPTAVELANLTALQNIYQDRLIQEADFYVGQSQNNYIAPKHQAAAKARGVVRSWVIAGGDMKECPNCAEAIYATAIGCKSCGTNLPDWYENNFFSPAQVRIQDPKVATMMETRLRNKEARQAGAKIPAPTAAIPAPVKA